MSDTLHLLYYNSFSHLYLGFFTFNTCTFPRSTLIDATYLQLHFEASFHITWLFQQNFYITGSYGLRRYRRMTTTKNMTLSGRWWIILPSHRRPLELRPLPSDASIASIQYVFGCSSNLVCRHPLGHIFVIISRTESHRDLLCVPCFVIIPNMEYKKEMRPKILPSLEKWLKYYHRPSLYHR